MPNRLTFVTAARLGREDTYLGLSPGFETEKQAKDLRDKLYETCAQGSPEAQRLAAKLEPCMSDDRLCGSDACPVCKRRARMRIVPLASAALYEEGRKEKREWKKIGQQLGHQRPEIHSITCVDASMAVARGGLDAERLNAAKKAMQTFIGRSPIKEAKIFGGWDFSLNFVDQNDQKPIWYPHLFLLTAAPRNLLEETFRDRFAVTEAVPKPLHIKKVQCLPGAVSYAVKSQCYRRVGYEAADGRKSTFQRTLKPDELRELAVCLDKLGINARLVLRGWRIFNGCLVET